MFFRHLTIAPTQHIMGNTQAGEARHENKWDYQLMQNDIYPRATCGEEP